MAKDFDNVFIRARLKARQNIDFVINLRLAGLVPPRCANFSRKTLHKIVNARGAGIDVTHLFSLSVFQLALRKFIEGRVHNKLECPCHKGLGVFP